MRKQDIENELKALDAILGQYPTVEPSPGFVGKVVAAAEPKQPWWRQPQAIAAAVAGAILVVAIFTTSRSDDVKQQREDDEDPILELSRHVPPAPLVEDAEDLDRTWRRIQWIEENFLPTTE